MNRATYCFRGVIIAGAKKSEKGAKRICDVRGSNRRDLEAEILGDLEKF